MGIKLQNKKKIQKKEKETSNLTNRKKYLNVEVN